MASIAVALALPAWSDGSPATGLDREFDDCMTRVRAVEQANSRRIRRRAAEPGTEAQPPPDLRSLCPEIHAALAAAPFGPLLPPDWDQTPSGARLSQLRDLLDWPAPPADGRRLDPSGVAPILEQIRSAQVEAKKSMWQRFKDWLAGILERRRDDESGWLAEWLREHVPSDRVMKWIAYGLATLLMAGAAWVVVAELRANGLLRRRARQAGGMRMLRGDAGRSRPAASLGDASETELPVLLIGLLLERLRALGRVQDRQSMTHRELVAAARFDSADDGSVFAALVGVAERLRYASVAPARAQLREAVEAARALLSRLAQPPRSAA